MKELNLKRTKAALIVYDAMLPSLSAAFDRASSDGAIYSSVSALNEAKDRVRRAFLEDTADRNRWSQVKEMPLSDIREFVEKVKP